MQNGLEFGDGETGQKMITIAITGRQHSVTIRLQDKKERESQKFDSTPS